jgi:type I restriction enzyme S subunit
MTTDVHTTQRAYPAHKDSGIEWIGVIPSHWSQAPVFTVATQHKLRNIKTLENNVLSLSYGKIVRRDIETNYGLLPESFDTYNVVDQGDVILRLTDLQNDKTSLRVGLVEERGIITSAYVCLRFFSDEIHYRYAYYLLHGYDVLKVFYSLGDGVRQSMNFVDLKWLPVLLPPLPEQEAIARFLDHKTAQIDALIAKKEALLARLADKRTALISQAVTQGLDPTVPMRDSGIEWLGEIPEHWEIKKAKYLTDILRGKFTHRPRNDPRLYDGEYPFIQTGDVASADMYIRSYSQTLNDEGFKVSKQFPHGTLVMTIAANIGDIAILDFAACFPDSIVGFVPKPSVDLFYLYYMFVAMRQQLLLTAVLNTQLNLNVERIANQFCVLPPISQQLEIVEFLNHSMTKLESLAVNIEHAIDKLKQYRTALITNAVTGKIDVREAGSWATQAPPSS